MDGGAIAPSRRALRLTRPTLLVAESLNFSATAALSACMHVRLANLSATELIAELSDVEALWVRLRFRIDDDLLEAAPRLRWLATPTTGTTHVDEAALARRGIELVCLRGQADFLKNIRATSEHTVLLMLAALRHLVPAAAHVVAGGWERDRFRGGELSGRTVGLIGLGRLGTQVAEVLGAFGAHVVGSDPHVHGHAVPNLPLHDVLAQSDIVSLHVALTPATTGLVDAAFLRQMRPDATLINTARGEVVESAAILHAIDTGRLATYATDVLDGERSEGNGAHPLVARAAFDPRVIVTPHLGGCTVESMRLTEQKLALDLVRRVSAASGRTAG